MTETMTIPAMPDNPYLLLTPGPLSTTKRVKAAMLKDWCTWDREYNDLVQDIRGRLVRLATTETDRYTAVLMQGSGTFVVESVIGSAIPANGKLAVLINGAYGERIAQMAERLCISTVRIALGETTPADAAALEAVLAVQPDITHVAVVHTETTTGMRNPLEDIARTAKQHGKTLIADAMSSFGGIAIDVAALSIDFLISSSNKCIQGVPGFGFVIAKTEELTACAGRARSLSLDLYDQWETMERQQGKWRFTSPTHVVHAFHEALLELEDEGGIAKRQQRYENNQRLLVQGMEELGFQALLPASCQSPIITSFVYPAHPQFSFAEFYARMKLEGFVLYPGKISSADTFRIGNIGDVHADDIGRLLEAIGRNRFWL
ncbi:2-aminoethylphosphonate--pyruvate transaminase [Paenibacillus elgii]|nr:2-aminoethylphosphonate--pyruvate transaminase [Paenibacillus elgii]